MRVHVCMLVYVCACRGIQIHWHRSQRCLGATEWEWTGNWTFVLWKSSKYSTTDWSLFPVLNNLLFFLLFYFLLLPSSFHKIKAHTADSGSAVPPISSQWWVQRWKQRETNLPSWAKAPYVFWLEARWGASLMTFLILGPPSWPYIANAGCTYGASPFPRNCFYWYRFLSQP